MEYWLGTDPEDCQLCGNLFDRTWVDAPTPRGWGMVCTSCFVRLGSPSDGVVYNRTSDGQWKRARPTLTAGDVRVVEWQLRDSAMAQQQAEMLEECAWMLIDRLTTDFRIPYGSAVYCQPDRIVLRAHLVGNQAPEHLETFMRWAASAMYCESMEIRRV